jgi:oxygen-independent coproporphyrinogen III oxidase
MIDGDQLKALITLCQQYQPEQFTIELNPEDVTPELLANLDLERWTNLRLSMGLQTFHQPSLDAVGRKVTTQQMEAALAQLAPYKQRLNLDLIVSLPYHTQAIALQDMEQLLAYQPSHISLYALAMEQNTQLTHRPHAALPNEEERTSQWQSSQNLLLNAGYLQYEVSNYALNAAAYSVQNCHYWQLKPYVGIGPGAVGTLVLKDGSALRVSGKKALRSWVNQADQELWEYEKVSAKEFLFEHYMMGLRMNRGIEKRILVERFGDAGLEPWQRLQASRWGKYAQSSAGFLTLSDEGRLFLDAILVELLG